MYSATIEAIGIIHTGHRQRAGTPIQPRYASGAEGRVEVFAPYVEGLLDLDGFERVWLVYAFDRAPAWQARVVPFRDTVSHGLFATRAPRRPNAIGMSVVRLLAVEGASLRVADVDMLDGSPLLDIKPYVPAFDAYPDAVAGWVDAGRAETTHADARFDR